MPSMDLRSAWISSLGHAAADGWGDDAELGHELIEAGRIERLRAVGERVVGIVVDFDEQAVGARGYRGASHCGNFVAPASAVRRIGNHREMRKLLDDGNGCDVERVASVGLEGADAAFAEDDVVVAAGKNVFGAHKKFLHGGGETALEQNGLANFAEGAQQKIVLHVARADLEHVNVAGHHGDLRSVHDFADGEQAEFVSGFLHELQAFFAEALKGVGRGARLEGTGAQNFCASFADAFGDGVDLFVGFHRTGAGGDDYIRSAEFYAAA